MRTKIPAKKWCGKRKPVATRVQKIKFFNSISPLGRQIEFQLFQRCSPVLKKKTPKQRHQILFAELSDFSCLLSYLPITNNNIGLSMSKTFTSE